MNSTKRKLTWFWFPALLLSLADISLENEGYDNVLNKHNYHDVVSSEVERWEEPGSMGHGNCLDEHRKVRPKKALVEENKRAPE